MRNPPPSPFHLLLLHAPTRSPLCSVLGISSEAVRLRLMAAIVALRKQVSARAAAAERPVTPVPLPADAQQLHAPRNLPYLQLQEQPGGLALQQRDICSFFRPPPASSCSDE